MKKIIATVLAMVMALALCATAFADIAWTGYNNKGTKLAEDYSCTAVKATFDKKAGTAPSLTTGSRALPIRLTLTMLTAMSTPMT